MDNLSQLIAALEARPIFEPQAPVIAKIAPPVIRKVSEPIKQSSGSNIDYDQLAEMFASQEHVANLEARLAELE